MVDLEPTCMDEIWTGTYKDLFHKESLINAKEDAANNFAIGYCWGEHGREIVDLVLDWIRKTAELCTGLQGFVVYHSFSGGTGSGFTSYLLERLHEDYNKLTKIQFGILGSEQLSSMTVEPINTVLGMHNMIETSQVCFLFDNQSMYDIAMWNLDIYKPAFTNLNRLIA